MNKLLICGGLGNGSVIAAALIDAGKRGYRDYSFAGYLNDREPVGSLIQGYPVLGSLEDSNTFLRKGYFFINAILRIDGNDERIKKFKELKIPDEQRATFIHPLAYVAPDVSISTGCVIMPNSCVSPGTKIGANTLVMVGVTIGHDNDIGKYCHFAAQACIGAYLKIGDGVHIGLNSTVRENLTIGENSTLGMGSILLKNMPVNEIWVGNPAKFLRNC